MRGHKTRRGHKGKKHSGTKRHGRGEGQQHEQYMALLRLANKVASESKGLYADAKHKGCTGLASDLVSHFIDTENLLLKLADFGRSVHIHGEALTKEGAYRFVHHAKVDLDKLKSSGIISKKSHAREVAHLAHLAHLAHPA